jgi:hypothetical protein
MSSTPQYLETFKYEKLPYDDSIRIFELQPSAQLSAEIHGRLMNETVSELDVDIVYHYTALSYVWGSTEYLKPIFINGHMFVVFRHHSLLFILGNGTGEGNILLLR